MVEKENLKQAQFAGYCLGAAFDLQFGEDVQVMPLDRTQCRRIDFDQRFIIFP